MVRKEKENKIEGLSLTVHCLLPLPPPFFFFIDPHNNTNNILRLHHRNLPSSTMSPHLPNSPSDELRWKPPSTNHQISTTTPRHPHTPPFVVCLHYVFPTKQTAHDDSPVRLSIIFWHNLRLREITSPPASINDQPSLFFLICSSSFSLISDSPLKLRFGLVWLCFTQCC